MMSMYLLGGLLALGLLLYLIFVIFKPEYF